MTPPVQAGPQSVIFVRGAKKTSLIVLASPNLEMLQSKLELCYYVMSMYTCVSKINSQSKSIHSGYINSRNSRKILTGHFWKRFSMF